MTVRAVRKPRQREVGYGVFQSVLQDGVIAPGQFLSQREIGALTGLPMRAVRELVARLEGDGLLVTTARGVKVASVDLALIRNAFQLRRFIEREAVRIYCGSASDADIAAQRAAHEAVLRDVTPTLAPGVRERFHAADQGLHDAIIAAPGNQLIEEINRVNAVRIRLIRRTQIRPEKFMTQTLHEHLAVIAACEARDPEAAADAIGAHLDNTMRRVLGAE